MSKTMTIFLLSSFFLFAVTVAKQNEAIIRNVKDGNCFPDDYSPCRCSSNMNGSNFVTCEFIPMNEIQSAFNRSITPHLTEVVLVFLPVSEGIPDQVLADHGSLSIRLNCNMYFSVPLKISGDAFASSRAVSNHISIEKCNMSQLKYNFLNGFEKLTILEIMFSTNMMGPNFAETFPTESLRALRSLDINSCSGYGSFPNLPESGLSTGLSSFYLTESTGGLDGDSSTALILDWIAKSSNSTLNNLYLYGNKLTLIPEQILAFEKILYLDVKNNVVPFISKDSLSFKSTIDYILLSDLTTNEIEAGAFQGNFQNVLVDLKRNNLTRFESSVFQVILEAGGIIDVKDNPFDCDEDPCSLAWIINDPSLMKSVKNAKCSNGSSFLDLNPDAFVNCLIVTTEKSTSVKETEGVLSSTFSSNLETFPTTFDGIGISSQTTVTSSPSTELNKFTPTFADKSSPLAIETTYFSNPEITTSSLSITTERYFQQTTDRISVTHSGTSRETLHNNLMAFSTLLLGTYCFLTCMCE